VKKDESLREGSIFNNQNNSFKIHLNRVESERKEEEELSPTKKEFLETLSNPPQDLQPIVFTRKLDKICAFAASTFQNFKKKNEDKINISINSKVRNKLGATVDVHNFAIFDGHGGSTCAEFLRDNLHKFIFEDPEFLVAPDESIIKGFNKAEEIIINKNKELFEKKKEIDRSGSCANQVFVFDGMLYVSNLGDSRTIITKRNMTEVYQLTKDHKPHENKERRRITNAGGQVYKNEIDSADTSPQKVVFRSKPGGLAVSRSLGDVEAKIVEFGGKPNVISNIPDVVGLNIDKNIDMLIMGSDGIYDKLSNRDIVINVIETCMNSIEKGHDLNKFVKTAVQNVLKLAIKKDSRDNISCIILLFENFVNYFNNKKN